MAKSHLFAHLLKHSRYHRDELFAALNRSKESSTKFLADRSVDRVAAAYGALSCLYWQALGCGEVLLARKIARTLEYTPKHGSPLMAQNTEARTPVK